MAGLSLEIAAGEFFALIGPSGCGKTTTLRMIAGFQEPTSGGIYVRDKNMVNTPAHLRPVNTVFQHYTLFPHLTVEENVEFGLRERGIQKRVREKQAKTMLELVGLADRKSARPRQLSGGQQQRVALARALVMEPEVLLLDEPLGALDLKMRKQMQMLIKSIQHQVGITFVYVTHDQEEAFSMADRVGVMREGRLEQVSSPGTLYRCPATRFVADFVGAPQGMPVKVDGVAAEGFSVDLGERGGSLVVPGVSSLKAGDSGWLVLRPEAIRLADPTVREDRKSDAVSLRGTVEDIAFLGLTTQYRVEVPDIGTILATRSSSTTQPSVNLGDLVDAMCPASVCWLVEP